MIEWKPVPGYEGRYDVSNAGNVRSWRTSSGKQRTKPAELRAHRQKSGYVSVVLVARGTQRRFANVHRLVLEAFVGTAPIGRHAAHLNGVRHDNRAENLQWKTPSENEADKRKHGTSLAGARNHAAKLTPDDVAEVRRLRSTGWTLKPIAARFKVALSTIQAITSGSTWARG